MYYCWMPSKHSIVFVIVNYLINKLLDRKVCPCILQLLCHMYLNQASCVKWNSKNLTEFSVSNGVKQGAVMSPILSSVYIHVETLLGCRNVTVSVVM